MALSSVWSPSSIDPESGALETIEGPVVFEGVLPEKCFFDRDGDGVAVAVYHEKSEALHQGWVTFFAIDHSQANPRILPTGQRGLMMRGSHDLAVRY